VKGLEEQAAVGPWSQYNASEELGVTLNATFSFNLNVYYFPNFTISAYFRIILPHFISSYFASQVVGYVPYSLDLPEELDSYQSGSSCTTLIYFLCLFIVTYFLNLFFIFFLSLFTLLCEVMISLTCLSLTLSYILVQAISGSCERL
jgi:hypothetical protein